MRVLIIFNHPAPYKVSAFNELAKYVDLTVIFERTKAKDRPDSFYQNNEYHFNHIFFKKGYIGKEGTTSNEVKDYLKKHHQEYDVILMNGYSHLAEIKAIKYLSSQNIKFGLLINGGWIKRNEFFLKRLYKKSLISKASYYLSPSKVANEYLKYYGAKEETIYNYLYSNYSLSEIKSATEEEITKTRNKYNLPLDKKIFINPSQFIQRKNNLQLISLFKDSQDALLLIGEGKCQKEYENYIKNNHMNNVYILPFKTKRELAELYKASDVHITLSKYDIFGHTILEAFANGIPVISSNKVLSALEYIKDGYNGYIVDIENQKNIRFAIKNTGKSMKNNALESAKNNTFESSALSIYEILKKIYE